MNRIKFKKGEQRNFLLNVLKIIGAPSLKELVSRGFDISYSTLKNYFNESRNLPENIFNDLCLVSKINKTNLKFEVLEENYGQVLGGKKSRKVKLK